MEGAQLLGAVPAKMLIYPCQPRRRFPLGAWQVAEQAIQPAVALLPHRQIRSGACL